MQILPTRRPQSHRRGGNNGGFPDPPKGEPVRLVRCSHPSCGTETRIRLPERLPERVVQRVVCDGCRQTFTSPGLERIETPAEAERVSAEDRAEAASVPAEPEGAPANAGPLPPAAATAAAFSGAAADRASAEAALDDSAAPADPVRESGSAPGVGERLRGWSAAAGERLRGLGAAVGAGGSGGVRDRVRDRIDGLPMPSLPEIPRRRLWAWASVPLALLGVIVGLSLIQGSSPEPRTAADAAQTEAADEGAKLVKDAGYSLALPAGWKQVDPPDGATFAAETRDGSANATLWIERAPGLSLKDFERRSLEQLGEIAENPRVVDRVNAPTIEGSIVELRGDTPVSDGVATPYRVTLRGAGPFRHYLATAQQPSAGPKVVADIEILHNSLRPEVKLAGTGD